MDGSLGVTSRLSEGQFSVVREALGCPHPVRETGHGSTEHAVRKVGFELLGYVPSSTPSGRCSCCEVVVGFVHLGDSNGVSKVVVETCGFTHDEFHFEGPNDLLGKLVCNDEQFLTVRVPLSCPQRIVCELFNHLGPEPNAGSDLDDSRIQDVADVRSDLRITLGSAQSRCQIDNIEISQSHQS